MRVLDLGFKVESLGFRVEGLGRLFHFAGSKTVKFVAWVLEKPANIEALDYCPFTHVFLFYPFRVSLREAQPCSGQASR